MVRAVAGFILAAMLIWPWPAFTQPEYIFNKLTNEDGLSYSTVFDFAQDSSGVLWIATKQGLNRYNGNRIKTYLAEEYPSLPTGRDISRKQQPTA